MEWISVKDRLPEKYGDYLCTDGEYMHVIYFHNHKFEAGQYCLFVTHWMPLPKLPGE